MCLYIRAERVIKGPVARAVRGNQSEDPSSLKSVSSSSEYWSLSESVMADAKDPDDDSDPNDSEPEVEVESSSQGT